MNNKANNLIFKLFDDVKRFQNNIDESLAITLGLVYLIYTDKESFLTASGMHDPNNTYPYIDVVDFYMDNIRNRMDLKFANEQLERYLVNNIKSYEEFATFSKIDIKNAIENLLQDKCPMLQASSRQTDSFTQRVITQIAKLLNSKGPYIDLAVGTGSLLKDFDGEVWGDDINPKMVVIARCYLYFYLNDVTYESLINDIRLQDSIETFNYTGYKNAVILFDPPMGDFRLYPKDERWQNTEIFNKKPVKLQSEILFLMNFLVNAKNNDYFIGLFPENILNKNSYEYNNIRKYLIEHSLICVIRVLTGHVLLIGQKKLDIKKYPDISVIRIQQLLNSEQLDFIVKEIIKGKDINFTPYFSIKPSDFGTIIKNYDSIENYNKDFRSITYAIYKRNDLLKNNFAINLPEKLTYEDLHKNNKETLQELLKKINDNEEEIKIKIQQINDTVSQIQSKEETQYKFEPWFSNNITDKINNVLSYFYSKYYLDLLTEDNIESWFDFQIRDNVTPEKFTNLKILFESRRVKLLKNKVKIYFGENKENLQKDINWMEFYNLFDPLKDKDLKCIFELTNNDKNIKLIFENLCQYWMLDQNEDNTLLKQKEFPIKEFTRCLKVLENLGLVIFDKRKVYTSEHEHSEIDLYKRFIPNIKYIDAIRIEEAQNVR